MKLKNFYYSESTDALIRLPSGIEFSNGAWVGPHRPDGTLYDSYLVVPRVFRDNGTLTFRQSPFFSEERSVSKLTNDGNVTHIKFDPTVRPGLKGTGVPSLRSPHYYGEPCGYSSYYGTLYFRSSMCIYPHIFDKDRQAVFVPPNAFCGGMILTQRADGTDAYMSCFGVSSRLVRVRDRNGRWVVVPVTSQFYTGLNAQSSGPITFHVSGAIWLLDTGEARTWSSEVSGESFKISSYDSHAQSGVVFRSMRAAINRELDKLEAKAKAMDFVSCFPYMGQPSYFEYAYPNSRQLMSDLTYDILKVCTMPSASEWGDLCQSAIDDCHWTDVNTIAYLKDFQELFSEVKAVAGLVADYENPRKWASAYLSFKYGTRLTWADTLDLIDSVKSAVGSLGVWLKSYHAVRSRAITQLPGGITRTDHYKVYYHNPSYSSLNAIKNLMDWGAWPTMENLWDLIPYSFVVDWFVNFSSFFDDFDTNIYAQYLDIDSVTRSSKFELSLSTLPSASGIVLEDDDATFYQRKVLFSLDLPVPSFSASDGWKANIATLLAIIVQRG